MLEATRPANLFNVFGRFRDEANEREFRIATWREEQKAFEFVFIVATILYIAGIALDLSTFGAGNPQIAVSLAIRLIVIVATLGFTLNIHNQDDYSPNGFAGFCQELLIICGYLVIANMMPELVHLQTASLTVMLVFVWFFVPIHPIYSLISTGVIMAGSGLLHFRYAPEDHISLFLSVILYAGVLVMGILSARSREELQRAKFLDQKNLETINGELRKEIETRLAAQALEARTREQFEGLFQASPMPLVLSNHENGRILVANQACAELLGRPITEIVGHSHKEFVNLSDAYEEFDRLVDLEPGKVSAELEVKRPDGTIRHCTVTAVRVDDQSQEEEQILTGIYDLTDQKEFEYGLVAARLTAEAAQKTQSEFLATMSHEIRTPLNALLGFIQVIELDDISDTVRGSLGLARQSGEHLLRLITDILDLSRLNSGKVELEPVDVNCDTMCKETIETFIISAKDKHIELRYENMLSGQCYEFDELRIRQVLFNLVGNAIKFTHSGAVTLSIDDSSGDELDQRWIRVEVRDTGIGIDAEKVGHIFQEFTQADASITRKFGGTGLGLAISNKLIDAMGGKIGVRANTPAGSVFWFEIPVNETGDGCCHEAAPQREVTQIAHLATVGKVLVAEDNPMNQRVIGAFLDSLGFDYEVVGDGQQAVVRLCSDEFALVLMDIQMPVLDGLSAIRFIRSGATSDPKIRIVALTANAMAGDRETYLAAGADDYLAKPVTLNELRRVLAGLVEASHSSPQNTAAN